MRTSWCVGALVALLLIPVRADAIPIVLDFEGIPPLADPSILVPVELTDQLFSSGVTFENTILLASGRTLDAFWPVSGEQAISSNTQDPLRMLFVNQITSFMGSFVYSSPTLISGYLGGIFQAAATSTFDPFGGDPQASSFGLQGLFDEIQVVATPLESGEVGFYTVDDVTLQPIPEPGTLTLIAIGGAAASVRRRRQKK